MNDLRWIKENQKLFDSKLQDRGLAPEGESIVKMDSDLREVLTKIQKMQSKRNDLSAEIGKLKKENHDTKDIENESIKLKEAIDALCEVEKNLRFTLDSMLARIPNLILDDVPVGTSEFDNVEIKKHGVPRKFDFSPKIHYEIGEKLRLMDFSLASKLSGSRFTILKGDLAKLERALASFMLDIHTNEFGYTEMNVPVLVKDLAMFCTGQFPKFMDDSFITTDGRCLIPTAEVPLTNTVRDSIIDVKDLPIRMTAHTQCFRSEAGAAGKDTRGMIRNHQFEKVELVSVVHPDDELAELERMRNAAETILQRLDIPYRVILLCSGDIGFSARKTYDIEVWLPGENAYREISSCSTCGQFQARRMSAKYRDDMTKDFVVTLNGSGLAIGRTLVAVLENYQKEDGNVKIPDALVKYMDGKKEIG